jgi:hypothetical protein
MRSSLDEMLVSDELAAANDEIKSSIPLERFFWLFFFLGAMMTELV